MRHALLILTLLLATAETSPAAIIFDSGGFEAPAYSLGQLVGQSTTAPPSAQWTDLLSPTGNTFMVQNTKTNGGSQAVSVSSTSQQSTYVAPLVNYTPIANELVVIEVDIARTISSQAFLPSSYSYAVEAYDQAGFSSIRFGLRANLTNNGIEAFVARQDPAGAGIEELLDVQVAQNQWVRFRAELNYQTDSFRLLVDGIERVASLGFITAATNLGDVDLNHNTTVGAVDVGYFDNYRISTVAVPEPGLLAWSTLLCVSCAMSRRKRPS